MRNPTGRRSINELIKRYEMVTLPPGFRRPEITTLPPSYPRKRRRKKVLATEGSRITAASIIGILVGATGHALITRKQ